MKSPSLEGRNESGQFQKGVSGNPGGRPKRTPAEQQAIDKMKEATPEMVELVLGIARSEKSSFYAKLQAAELILNRSMGKPETYLRVENGEMSREEATASLMALFSAEEDAEEEDDDEVEPLPDEESSQAMTKTQKEIAKLSRRQHSVTNNILIQESLQIMGDWLMPDTVK